MNARDENYFRGKLKNNPSIEDLYPNDKARVSVLYSRIYGLAMDALDGAAFPNETRRQITGLTRKINKILRENKVRV